MKKLSKKKRRAEREFMLSLLTFTLSLCFLFICMLDVMYNYYPGSPEQGQMTAYAVITFISTSVFGFFTAITLRKYSTITHQISLYKRGQKNKMEIN